MFVIIKNNYFLALFCSFTGYRVMCVFSFILFIIIKKIFSCFLSSSIGYLFFTH